MPSVTQLDSHRFEVLIPGNDQHGQIGALRFLRQLIFVLSLENRVSLGIDDDSPNFKRLECTRLDNASLLFRVETVQPGEPEPATEPKKPIL